MNDVLLGIGSNLGDSRELLREAVQRLGEYGRIRAVSRVWKSEPVGYADQGWFLNLAVRWETELSPMDALASIRTIESEMGRQREIPNGPRTIDIDILLWNRAVIHSAELEIPHPRMYQRRFVLGPSAEIAGSLRHPELQRTVQELLDGLEDEAAARPDGELLGGKLGG